MSIVTKSNFLLAGHYVALIISGIAPTAAMSDSCMRYCLLALSAEFRALPDYYGADALRAINFLQHEYLWYFIIGGLVAWVALILTRIFMDRRVSSLAASNMKLNKDIEQYETLSRNVSSIFGWQLMSIGKVLRFSDDERISLYINDDTNPGMMKCIARYASRSSYGNCKRLYPKNEGVIQKVLDHSEGRSWSLPKWPCERYYKRSSKEFGLSRATVDALTMHPRWIYGVRIYVEGQVAANGAIVIESNVKEALGEVEVNELIGSRMAMLHDLIERFGNYAPSLHKIT